MSGSGSDASDRAAIIDKLSMLYHVKQAMQCLQLCVESSAASSGTSDDAIVAGIARFAPLTDEESGANKTQQFLMHLLNVAATMGYRKKGTAVYQKVRIGDVDTHAWRVVCNMSEFVHMATRRETNFDMWMAMTSMRSNIPFAIEYLEKSCDYQFPNLVKDRHVFSFRNGIYLADKDRFIEYDTEEHRDLPSDLVAARFFDMDMPRDVLSQEDPESIETPSLQAILDYQDMSPELCGWVYALIGRLIYEVNERDKWQVLPFLKGAAASGKSTILMSVCRNLYEPEDVGVISNNIERKFGLSAVFDKFIFIAPEVKADFGLEQAEFQSMVTGETVQIAIKFQVAKSVVWSVPGIVAGNQNPYEDNRGSMARRTPTINFTKTVVNGDMDLGNKIFKEMPAILVKCNRLYNAKVAACGHDVVWRHLPQEFHQMRDELVEDSNSIIHFLKSGHLEFGTGLYMPFVNFARMYESYVQSMGLVKLRLTMDKITQPLVEKKCRVVKNQAMLYPRGANSGGGIIVNGQFILGLDCKAAQVDSMFY